MDKLEILNRALIATGNNPVALNDGSDEWQVVDTSFDRALDDLISRHGWPFARKSQDLVPTSPLPSRRYRSAHALPADALHLRLVLVNSVPTVHYEIFGRALCLDAASGVSVEYIAKPADVAWHPQATEILTLMVEVGCLRGLNEDLVEARLREMKAAERLSEVRALIDSENPARNVYRGGATAARFRRRG